MQCFTSKHGILQNTVYDLTEYEELPRMGTDDVGILIVAVLV